MKSKTLSKFYIEDYPSFGAYDNIRKISGVDGLKLSQRKALYTFFKKFNKPSIETKTARMASTIAETTEYVHGEGSLCVVLETMAASYVGSNNYPLIVGHGNFGTRFSGPGSAAAPRYTYVSISNIANILFNLDDRALCKSQIFEGTEIEPQFYVPIFPLTLLNGIDGLSTGWKAQVFPRNPKDIIKYIKAKLDNSKHIPDPDKFLPYFKGFKGTVKTQQILDSNGKAIREEFVSCGIVSKKTGTELEIMEIPIQYSYDQYIKVLDKLLEKGTILDYDDQSDPKTDSFKFIVKVKRDFFNTYQTQDDWAKVFSLSKTLPEQLNLVDENNKIREFSSIREILDAFIKIRLEYYAKRKKYLIDKRNMELQLNVSRYLWCKGIIEETIKIRNVKKDDVIAQLKQIDKIIEQDGSYNYLLNMSLSSITREKMAELKEQIKALKDQIASLKSTTEIQMWLDDLKEFEKYL